MSASFKHILIVGSSTDTFNVYQQFPGTFSSYVILCNPSFPRQVGRSNETRVLITVEFFDHCSSSTLLPLYSSFSSPLFPLLFPLLSYLYHILLCFSLPFPSLPFLSYDKGIQRKNKQQESFCFFICHFHYLPFLSLRLTFLSLNFPSFFLPYLLFFPISSLSSLFFSVFLSFLFPFSLYLFPSILLLSFSSHSLPLFPSRPSLGGLKAVFHYAFNTLIMYFILPLCLSFYLQLNTLTQHRVI